MYISRDSVFAKFEQMFDTSVIEVIKSLNKLEIEISKQEIGRFLNDKLENEKIEVEACYGLVAKKAVELELNKKYSFNELDYDIFNNLFIIYKNKAKILCKIVQMVAGEIEVDETLLEELDIKILNEYVRYADVLRIFVPLMRNYNLAVATKKKAEDKNSYLENCFGGIIEKDEIAKFLPDSSLVDKNMSSSDPTQYVTRTARMAAKEIGELALTK